MIGTIGEVGSAQATAAAVSLITSPSLCRPLCRVETKDFR